MKRKKPMRCLDEIRADIKALEQETDVLLEQILVEISDSHRERTARHEAK
jgi:hypothetical protein